MENQPPRLILGTDARVIALGVARAVDAVGNSFLVVTLPLYIASGRISGGFFGWRESFLAGLVLALFGIASSVTQPLAGRLSDRHGRRRLFILLGLVILAAANLSFSFVQSYPGMMAARAVQGIAAALTITASVALVNELSTSRERGYNMGVYNSFRLVGFGAGPLVAGVVIERGPYDLPLLGSISGYDLAFAVAAGGALIGFALVAALVRDPVVTRPTRERLALRVLAADPERLLDPIFTLGISTFVMSACFALLTPIEPRINSRLHQGPVLFSIEFAILIGMLAVAQPILGRASDRSGRKRFILAGLLALLPTTFVQGFVTSPWQLIAARALQGIAAAAVFAPSLALAGDLAREGQSGAQLAVLTMAFGLGISGGQLLAGYTVRFGFAVPFVLASGLSLAAAVLVRTQVDDLA